MVKILISNQNLEQNAQLCQYLTNDNDLKIIGTTDGISTLEQYHKIKPDIFILYTNIKDINYIDIINQLSCDSNEILNCNILLVSSIPDETIRITNIAKIYKVIYSSKFQDISNTVVELSKYSLDKRIDRLFLKLKIRLSSEPSLRLRGALKICYHSPELVDKLNTLYDLVAKDFGTTTDGIRSSLRTILKSVNGYKSQNPPPFTIYKLLGKDDLSPKDFLDVAIYYLRNIKN